MKFIHITDTHFVSPTELLKGLNPADRFASCIDSINRDHADADCCVITGDLADSAKDSAYQYLVDQLNRCNIKCHVIIGNHDDRTKALHWLPDLPTDEHGFIQYSLQTQAGVFVFLDTVQTGTHSGEYCEKRRFWLSKILKEHANQPVFLFMHHPPFSLHMPNIDKIGLVDQQAFADIVRQHKNIRHLFFGHAHRPLSGNWMGISFSSLRGTNHQIALDFNSEKFSFVDERPEYSVIFISDDQIVVHTHAYPLRDSN